MITCRELRGSHRPISDAIHWSVWFWRVGHTDSIAGLDYSALHHNAQDPCFTDEISVSIAVKHRTEKTFLKPIYLSTWISQPGENDQSLVTNAQRSARWERNKVKSSSGDVFPEISGLDNESLRRRFCKQFLTDQVHLTEIGLRWIRSNPRSVHHICAVVCVADYAVPRHQFDRVNGDFRKRMGITSMNCNDTSNHLEIVKQISNSYFGRTTGSIWV
jgi:hypothetical protein